MKYAPINCQDCRSVHILQSQSLSMFLFFLQYLSRAFSLLGSCSATKYSKFVSLTFLKFVRNLNASVLDSIVSSEHMYINKLRHVHLFTGWGNVLFTDYVVWEKNWAQTSCEEDFTWLEMRKPWETVTSTVTKCIKMNSFYC